VAHVPDRLAEVRFINRRSPKTTKEVKAIGASSCATVFNKAASEKLLAVRDSEVELLGLLSEIELQRPRGAILRGEALDPARIADAYLRKSNPQGFVDAS